MSPVSPLRSVPPPPKDNEAIKELRQAKNRYHEACHAVRRGVDRKWEFDSIDTNTTELRVAINGLIAESNAMAILLLDKGIFTEIEYFNGLADAMESIKSAYEGWLSSELGTRTKL